jgi:ABC-type multidrug transport system ATPase subunit
MHSKYQSVLSASCLWAIPYMASHMQVKGKVTYNGHEMTEFVPERTAAYISQDDLHIGEMTVRETLAFSARCQGVGSRFGRILNS